MTDDRPSRTTAAADGTPAEPVSAEEALRRLAASASIELTPREVERIGPLSGVLGPGRAVYVTAIPGSPHQRTIDAAARIAADGLRPVPHVAVRSFPALADVERFLRSLVDVAGVDEVLLIAGSIPQPAGDLDSTLQVLRSGLLEHVGIRRAGVAGHPEGHPDVPQERIDAALSEKNEIAAAGSLDLHVVTQFAFSAEAYVSWERRIRAAGITLPVHAGLPGVTSARKLLRYGISCGIGPSLRVLRKQTRGIAFLVSRGVFRPDGIASGIAAAVSSDRGSLFRSFHLYPFGGFEDTVRWLRETSGETSRERAS